VDIVELNLTMLDLENQAVNVPEVIIRDRATGRYATISAVTLGPHHNVAVLDADFTRPTLRPSWQLPSTLPQGPTVGDRTTDTTMGPATTATD
jgi:hypothetical protein